MQVTIVGGGNIGTQFAVHCAEKGHRVTMFTSKPELFSSVLSIVDETDQVVRRGNLSKATSDPAEAFTEADLIFVTVPAFGMKNAAAQIYPHHKQGVKIALIPGTGGGECAFRKCVDKGAVVFGLQRVPSVARLVEYGKTVRAVGYRPELFAAAIPYEYTEECCSLMKDIFDMPCIPLPCYLNVTLTPSNPILHTTRLRVLYKDYVKGMKFDSVPLFYEGWNDESSELLLKCDEEVQQLCRAMPEFNLEYVRSLRVHYESETAEQLTRKLTSIASFKGLKSPTIEIDGKFIPDFESRYFTADFPFGLSILKQMADIIGVNTPNINETLEWYYSLADKKEEFSFEHYNLHTKDELIAFYAQ